MCKQIPIVEDFDSEALIYLYVVQSVHLTVRFHCLQEAQSYCHSCKNCIFSNHFTCTIPGPYTS